ncbi:uncharacterized protein G2W53_002262 [Senna tora]|uniref:Uncharacterized protein n=1 Tax=Senna tora TaxID=362788 RepID=A0A835CNB4_9FABA|nr:uncharacterized protein G2W53_002262 [Senna tora]
MEMPIKVSIEDDPPPAVKLHLIDD